MTGDDQPNVRSSCHEGDIRAIVKGTQSATFRMRANFKGRTRQNRLDDCQIQESIVTTAPDEPHICVQDIFEDSGVAIQAIQPHQDLGEEEFVHRCVPGDDLESPLQFFPVIAVASSPKSTQELMRMGLQKRGAGSHDFPPLASLVSWGRNLGETSMRGGQRWELRECALTSGLPGSIDIYHHILLVKTIPQAADRGERGSRHQICLKLRAQSLHRWLIKGGEKTREGRTIWQPIALKECHEDLCKWGKTRVVGIEGSFTAESIAQQHDDEINGVIGAETCASKLHLVLDGCEQADMPQDLSESCHFSHPAWG